MNDDDNFQIGDKVQYVGTVSYIHPDGRHYCKGPDGSENIIWPANLTLVERPEPTRTFELTEAQVNEIYQRSLSWSPLESWAFDALNAFKENND